MLGSQLLDQQPIFRGADFGTPELALYHFRHAIMTQTAGKSMMAPSFMLPGEACWEFSDERLAQIKGGQASSSSPARATVLSTV